jgi:hypothetical protein
MYCCVWVGRDRGNGMLKNKCIVACGMVETEAMGLLPPLFCLCVLRKDAFNTTCSLQRTSISTKFPPQTVKGPSIVEYVAWGY